MNLAHFAHSLSPDVRSSIQRIGYDIVLRRGEIVSLQKNLCAYAEEAAKACEKNEFLDRDVCSALIEASDRILATASQSSDAQYVQECLTAVTYFLKKDDADPDLSSLMGWDDDMRVFEAFLTHYSLFEQLPEDVRVLFKRQSRENKA